MLLNGDLSWKVGFILQLITSGQGRARRSSRDAGNLAKCCYRTPSLRAEVPYLQHGASWGVNLRSIIIRGKPVLLSRR